MSELASRTEAFLAGGGADRAAFTELLAGIRAAQRAGDLAEVGEALARAALPTLDYTSATSLARAFRRWRAASQPPAQLRLALLSSATTDQLRALLELYLFGVGLVADVYEADYGVFRQEVLDPASDLYAFEPDVVFLAVHHRDVAGRPALSDAAPEIDECLRREVEQWSGLWRKLHQRLGCTIVQNAFELPSVRVLGNHELRHPASPGRYLLALNLELAKAAPPFVTLHDLDALSAAAGRRVWADERLYHHAKLPCGPEFLADYAHSAASLIAAQRGLARKCLVLDLDNTLWGGVIGDDGIGGIRLGQGDPEGEAFIAFQHYARALKERGVILAVCSKNDEQTARAAFDHPEMVLGLDDIACFVASWSDKAANLRTIAGRLDIGLDSLVLVDDSPMERALVRRFEPAVAVPELPEDPSGFIDAVERHRYFQVVALSGEDYRRTDYYRANAERSSLESDANSIEEFLVSLEMVARVEPIGDHNLPRIAQLVARSNQFNLTTRRRAAAELLDLVRKPDWWTVTISLSDRFGDNGLVSVVLARVEGSVLTIDTWLMSCRVLKRGVEQFVLGVLYRRARAAGLGAIRGEYIPTPRNGLVRDHYASLGFSKLGEDESGRTLWNLEVRDDWTPAEAPVRERCPETQGDG